MKKSGSKTIGINNICIKQTGLEPMSESNTYIQLLTQFPPRPIASEEELSATQDRIDKLLDKKELSSDERDYLNLLGTLVYEYEQTLEPIPDISGIELLKVLLQESGLKENDLIPIFETELRVSSVLNNQQQLTIQQITQLANLFHISPAAFLPRLS
ncbi:MAG: transcriptional regulator [Desertifilum sp.]|nr:transcriptional regulator [Desertifilum sp.]